MPYTLNFSPIQETALARVCAAHNHNLPANAHIDPEQFLHMILVPILDGYVTQYAKPVVSRTEFLRRIPQAKRVAIRAAAANSAVLADYLALLDASPEVDLLDPDTTGGMQAMVSAGLLTRAEADAVLAV